MCCRMRTVGVAPKHQGLQGLGRPRAAARIHMCASETKSFKAAPKDQRLHGIGRPTAAVSIHMCVWQNNVSSRFAPKGHGLQVFNRPRAAYTCKGQHVTRVGRPGSASSLHTCAAENFSSRLHPRAKGDKGLADQLRLLARNHTHTHVCVSE